MEWKASYETGERRIDGQHRNLFDQVNRLEGLLEADTLDQSQAGGTYLPD